MRRGDNEGEREGGRQREGGREAERGREGDLEREAEGEGGIILLRTSANS